MKTWMLGTLAGVFAVAALAVYVIAKPGDSKGDKVKEPSTEPAKSGKEGEPVSPLDFKLKDIDGKEMDLAQYKGKVVLMVNVASKCGLTKQYDALQSLYKKYEDKGLVVIGFPANNFGGQEPGTEEEIKAFCKSKYNVTFPMTSKISVAGDDQHALYKFLTKEETAHEFAGDIEWNFAKFLVDRNGNLMARFSSRTKPDEEQVAKAIETALKAEAAKTATAAAK